MLKHKGSFLRGFSPTNKAERFRLLDADVKPLQTVSEQLWQSMKEKDLIYQDKGVWVIAHANAEKFLQPKEKKKTKNYLS